MTVADWKAAYDQQVRPLMSWLPPADFEITPNGENRAYYRGLSMGRSQFYVPDHAVELDLLKHEAGHAAHDAAAAQRDLLEGRGTAGTDIYREVATIVSPGVVWPLSGPDLRDEWTAEAFRKAIGGDLSIVRYPDPPGAVSPYPVSALHAYFATMNIPRLPPPAIIDVRALLPFVGNIYGTFTPKDSLTFHWNGGPVPEDAEPIAYLRADANHHINQGWGGISYHKAIWRDGTLYITRDPAAVLAACGNALGNARSTHVQVMIGTGQSPTPEQWTRMAELAQAETTVHPHGPYWSGTECPGDEIRAWIGGLEDMTPEQDTRLRNIELQLVALINQQSALATNIPNTWMRRLFYGLNPLTGKRRGVNEVVPPEIVVPD